MSNTKTFTDPRPFTATDLTLNPPETSAALRYILATAAGRPETAFMVESMPLWNMLNRPRSYALWAAEVGLPEEAAAGRCAVMPAPDWATTPCYAMTWRHALQVCMHHDSRACQHIRAVFQHPEHGQAVMLKLLGY